MVRMVNLAPEPRLDQRASCGFQVQFKRSQEDAERWL